MPVHNQGFLTPDKQPSAEGLMQVGPVLAIEVGVPTPVADYLARQAKEIPPPAAGWALIDTGATRSGVDNQVIEGLGVNPIGETELGTARGAAKANLYPTRFNFSQQGFVVEFSSVIGCDLSALEFQDRRLIALVGRDVLSRGLLIYNGVGGTFTFAF